MSHKLTFGKYRLKHVRAVPTDYLIWFTQGETATAVSTRKNYPDCLSSAQQELAQRNQDESHHMKKSKTLADQVRMARRNKYKYFQTEVYCKNQQASKSLTVRLPKRACHANWAGRAALVRYKGILEPIKLEKELPAMDVDKLDCPIVLSWFNTEYSDQDLRDEERLISEATAAKKKADLVKEREENDTDLVELLDGNTVSGSLLSDFVSSLNRSKSFGTPKKS